MLNFLLEGETAAGGGVWESLIPILGIVLLIVFFYFFMIRPQRKQEKKDAEMRDALQVGDEVTYDGGYYIWQYSFKGKVDGIATDVDLDYSYRDFPTILKKYGLNNL